MGKAEFEGHFVEVDSRGDFVDQGTQVEIVKIDNSKIYIKPFKK
jgi:membrane protein implicated in regulation of membrane protease activity